MGSNLYMSSSERQPPGDCEEAEEEEPEKLVPDW